MKLLLSNHPSYLPIIFGTSLAAVTAHGAVIVIDDGTSGYSQTGSWSSEPRGDAQSGNWRYQNDAAGTETATYAFSLLANGKYVAARSTWSQANLSSAATYTLSNSAGSYTQNQQIKTNHFDTDGTVTYQRLSSFNGYIPFDVTDGTFTATVGDTDAARFLIADDIRLESVRSDVQRIHVIGNGDVGYSESATGWATWSSDTGDHGSDIRFATSLSATASFAFTGLENGTYRVSSAWTTGGGRPDDARYFIAGGPTITLNQQFAPNDDIFEEVNWEDLFTVLVVDGNLTVNLENAAGGGGGTALIADAVRLELIATIPEPTITLLFGLGSLTLLRRRRYV